MLKQKFLYILLAGLCSLSMSEQAYAQESFIQEQSFEKIHLSPDRVLICQEGIFYVTETGDVAPARLVSSDAAGLYIVAAFYKCPACNRWNSENVCKNPSCVLYGQ